MQSAPKAGDEEGERAEHFGFSRWGRKFPTSAAHRLDALKMPPTKIQPDLG